MGLNDLKPADGSRKTRKRKARGPASGNGKTAGRGHKGQKSRSGGKPARGFEGGQMPLHRRVPKRGFWNPFSKDIRSVNGAVVGPEEFIAARLIKKAGDGVKVLGNGDLERKLTVKAHKFSKAAAEKIAAAGGTVETL